MSHRFGRVAERLELRLGRAARLAARGPPPRRDARRDRAAGGVLLLDQQHAAVVDPQPEDRLRAVGRDPRRSGWSNLASVTVDRPRAPPVRRTVELDLRAGQGRPDVQEQVVLLADRDAVDGDRSTSPGREAGRRGRGAGDDVIANRSPPGRARPSGRGLDAEEPVLDLLARPAARRRSAGSSRSNGMANPPAVSAPVTAATGWSARSARRPGSTAPRRCTRA